MAKAKWKVEEIIWNNAPADYEEHLKNADWDTFYELSPVRESLYNWYPFKKDSSILLVSDGYGALAGILAADSKELTVLEGEQNRGESIRHRYLGMENISVLIGGVEQLTEYQYYDYIVIEKAAALREELRSLLADFCPFLKEQGRMLIPCENRLGMKYLCGVPDSVSQTPFGGLNHMPGEERLVKSSILQELDDCRQIKGYCLYYPAPDHNLPQAVYSDAYLPKKSIRDRVIPYYTEKEQGGLVYLENQISDDLIANGLFQALSNSILVECGKECFEQEVLFAALSTDRGQEHGFATIITGRQTVRKKILHPAGKDGLKLIYRNQQELSERGVPCVEAQLCQDFIEMPFIQGVNCMEYLRQLFDEKKREEIEDLFDRLYQMILQSSPQIPFEECRLKDGELTAENAGPVLAKAYIDMIPYNCFYLNEERQLRKKFHRKKFLFYDQEFVKEGYPAKYVLFRALRYSYIYASLAEDVIPLQYFKNKYGLDRIWAVFEREEAGFVEDNRNYDLLRSFYKWADISSEELRDRIKGKRTADLFQKKTYGIEVYRKDYELNKIKRVQMDILSEFIRICEENNLTYCAFYGTLLGAVRHKGYIPWDDDVDVLMPRKDYDKLLALAPGVFKKPYFLQTPESDPECFYGGYAKLRNSATTGLEERNKGHNCNQGIWIDVFPLDSVLKSPEEKKKQQELILKYQRLLLKKTYPDERMLWDLPEEEEEKIRKAGRWYSREKLCRLLHDTITDYGTELSDKVAVLARYRFGRFYTEYSAEDFEFVIPAKFENRDIMIPAGYENSLLTEYGGNYLYYASVRERKPHHKAIFDTEVSYIDYIARNGYNK